MAKGKDPAAQKAQARTSYEADLFPALLNDFIENYAKRKTRSWQETERLLQREFAPVWKKRLGRDITKRDVNGVLDAIVARGSPSAANHAFAAIRKLFSWSVERGYLEHSPCFGVRAPSRLVSRNRVLSDAELAAVWRAAEAMGYPFGKAVQLLILTAQRRGEVMGMRWSELDLLNALWMIPGSRNKSGRDHVIPLSSAALEFIEALPRLHEKLVFPARGRNSIASGFSKWKGSLDVKSGASDWRIHDLRRTVATGLAQLKVQPHVIERLLNHTTGTLSGVAGVYNRYAYEAEVRTALQLWVDKLRSLPD